ncbi:MAG: hypothetical protein J7576_02455, partial [Siphonobacter aquaeclarae]|nr:hypothetical protein [Siphonobacter aquaeclarae]
VPVAAVDHLTAAACFPTIQNAGFYGNLAVSGFDGKVNTFSAGAYGAAARVPHFFVPWVLKQFGQKVGWKFQGTFLQDPDAQRLVLANLFSLDAAGTITVKNHLPDMTAGGLLIELRKLFNLFLDFDVRRKICEISFVDDILKSQPLIDWTAKAALDWNKIPEVVNRLELAYDIDGNDALLKPIPAHMDKYVTPETPANEGGSTLPVRSRFSTYLTDAGTGLAVTSQAGISPNNKDSQQQGTPKLLFWNGLVGGLPTATAKTATSSLYFQGANSLPARYWKQFERFKGNTFLLRTSLALSPADLATFSFKNKVHIRGVNYLVGALKASLKGDQQAVPVEVELWRV